MSRVSERGGAEVEWWFSATWLRSDGRYPNGRGRIGGWRWAAQQRGFGKGTTSGRRRGVCVLW